MTAAEHLHRRSLQHSVVVFIELVAPKVVPAGAIVEACHLAMVPTMPYMLAIKRGWDLVRVQVYTRDRVMRGVGVWTGKLGEITLDGASCAVGDTLIVTARNKWKRARYFCAGVVARAKVLS